MCSSYSLSLLLVTICFTTINALDANYTVKVLRKYGHLPQTGLPMIGRTDQQTTANRPRCGVIDPSGGQKFVLQSKWNKKHLTYRILEYTEKLPRYDVDREIAKAFAMWARHTDLKFTPTLGPADIEIRFTRGTYDLSFDGPGGTLAYAYFPENGDIYFDESEYWITSQSRAPDGYKLYFVAVHELGHSLGLAHSELKNSVMFPFYDASINSLTSDDIAGIQTLYGQKRRKTSIDRPRTQNRPKSRKQRPRPTSNKNKPNTNGRTKTSTRRCPPNRELCSDPKLDAALSIDRYSVYLFKGNDFYILTKDGICSPPKSIVFEWRGLPGYIDGTFKTSDGKTFFFRDHMYWLFNGRRMLPGYPKSILQGPSSTYSLGKTKFFLDDSTIYLYKDGKVSTKFVGNQINDLKNAKLKSSGYSTTILDPQRKKYVFKNNHFYSSGKIATKKLLGCESERNGKKKKRNM